MKKDIRKEKLQIRLSEIPAEGREYVYSNESGELTVSLHDLIDDNPYSIRFEITPLGNVYELRGEVDTQLPRVCSKCGWDIQVPVKTRLNEIIMPKKEISRGDTQSKVGSLASEAEESTDVIYVDGGVLNTEDLVHELIALRDPTYPSCEKEVCPNLNEVKEKMRELESEAEGATAPKKNPFEALKNLKF